MESRVAEQKKQLRGELLRLRRETPRQQKQAIDRQICQHVINSPEYRQAQTIFAYWSTDEEIDTHAILADARAARQARLCTQMFEGTSHDCPSNLLGSGFDRADIWHSGAGRAVSGNRAGRIDLCLVPALACDASGIRLGYGGGFYDRFLPQTAACRMVLCAQERFLQQVPAEQHDMHCDCVVTENEVMRVYEK